jgi:hypothetical protein
MWLHILLGVYIGMVVTVLMLDLFGASRVRELSELRARFHLLELENKELKTKISNR